MQIFRRENTALAAGVATALLAALILSIWTIAVLSVREKLEYETRMFDADIVFSHRDTPPLASFFRSGNDFDYLKPAAIPGMDKVTFYLKSHAQVKCVFPISVAKARLLEDNPERKFIAEIPVISFQDNPCKDSVPFARDFFLSSASSKCPSPINMNSAFIAPSAALFDLLSKSQGPGNMTTGSGILLDGLSVNGNFHIRKAVILPEAISKPLKNSPPMVFAVIDPDSFSKITGLWQPAFFGQTIIKSGFSVQKNGFIVPLGKGQPLDLPALFSILNTTAAEQAIAAASLPATHLLVYMTDRNPAQREILTAQISQFASIEKLPIISGNASHIEGFGLPWDTFAVLLNEMNAAMWTFFIILLLIVFFANFAFLPSFDCGASGPGRLYRRIFLTQGFSCVLGFLIWCLVLLVFCLAGNSLITLLFSTTGTPIPDPAFLGIEIMPEIVAVFLLFTFLIIQASSIIPLLFCLQNKIKDQ